MYRAALTVGLILISACTSIPTQRTATVGIIRDARAALSSADVACHSMGKFAVVRYIDQADRTLTFDCVRV